MNNKLIILLKILGLSLVLGILWYFAGKQFVSINTVDHVSSYMVLAKIWYFILFLPSSILIFSQSKVLKTLSGIVLFVGAISVASGVVGYVIISDFKDDGLFGSIFSAPLWAPLYVILLLGGQMH